MANENKYQRKLIKRYESEDWFVLRLTTATCTFSKTGIPDLVAMKKNGDGTFRVKFIEVKAEGGVASALQLYTIKKLKEFGFEAVIDVENSL